MLKYIPPVKKGPPAAVSLTLYLCAATCLAARSMSFGPAALSQGLMIAFLVAAIQVTVRWSLSEYYYMLTDPDDPESAGSLVIVRRQGEREREAASLSLDTAIAFEPLPDGRRGIKRLEQKYGRTSTVFNYKANMTGGGEYLYIFEFNGKTDAVRIDADEAFAAELARRITSYIPKKDME